MPVTIEIKLRESTESRLSIKRDGSTADTTVRHSFLRHGLSFRPSIAWRALMISRRNALALIGGSFAMLLPETAAAQALNTILPVNPVAQTKNWSCWAAAAAMLLQWKNGIPYSEFQIAQMAGQNYAIAFTNDTGLNGNEFADFAAALGLATEAPQNFTPAGYESLLRAHGPLWVGSRLDVNTANSRRHIRVLRGISGDGTFDGSTAWVVDPDGGRDYQETVTQFASELEQIAIEELGAGNELYPQVIRF
jgi:hypothetical protein